MRYGAVKPSGRAPVPLYTPPVCPHLGLDKGLSCLVRPGSPGCRPATRPPRPPGHLRELPVTHRTTAVALIAVGALAVLAGCGSSASGTSTPAGTGGAASRGGDLVIARTADSQSMNNTTVFDNESIWVFEQIMQPLYTVTPDGKGVMPWLATGYTVSPNKLTYTFTLRSGVKFSTGKPM